MGGGRQRRQPSGSNHLGLHACAQRAVNGSRSEGAPVSAEQLTDVACVPGRGAGAPPRGRSLAPLSMEFFRQEYWIGLHFLLQGKN